ncbi:hypothetical protein [Loktanella sp. 3ANDIMAR09]|uniref:hypothetical protein n=1 Tax=Loktanella sp. 3ANDIMAR09 TaxID=1225657 RepID=UPI0009F8BD20|nr:hypothetical protein [Loktanella sp. 3ANDIMAR09]
MNYRILLLCISFFGLSACASVSTEDDVPPNPFIEELPEGVSAIAAPFQDLNAVMIDPTDGCYVYRHAGPVETTFLPLRTNSGRPICTRLPEQSEPG